MSKPATTYLRAAWADAVDLILLGRRTNRVGGISLTGTPGNRTVTLWVRSPGMHPRRFRYKLRYRSGLSLGFDLEKDLQGFV